MQPTMPNEIKGRSNKMGLRRWKGHHRTRAISKVHLVWQQLLIAKYLKDATTWTLMQVFDVTHQLHKLC